MIVLLSRRDLKSYARDYNLADLTLDDFGGLSEATVAVADFIAIMNDRGQVNIFRNRYGQSGLLPARDATEAVNFAIRRTVDSRVNPEPSILRAVWPQHRVTQEVRDEEEI